MFGLLQGDRYKKYQTLFLQATRKNKSLTKTVRELTDRVSELEEKIEELTRAPVKKKRTTKAKRKNDVEVATQEPTDDRNTDTSD
tara:strand:- start:551 stop:805 length:255 start_codon:yes stop_codon:yes gene_type:complete